jgi:hypothetical protein
VKLTLDQHYPILSPISTWILDIKGFGGSVQELKWGSQLLRMWQQGKLVIDPKISIISKFAHKFDFKPKIKIVHG